MCRNRDHARRVRPGFRPDRSVSAVLAELAKGRLRRKLPALREALQGRFRTHHAVLLAQILAKVDFLDETIGTAVAVRLAARALGLRPFSAENREPRAGSVDRQTRSATREPAIGYIEISIIAVSIAAPVGLTSLFD